MTRTTRADCDNKSEKWMSSGQLMRCSAQSGRFTMGNLGSPASVQTYTGQKVLRTARERQGSRRRHIPSFVSVNRNRLACFGDNIEAASGKKEAGSVRKTYSLLTSNSVLFIDASTEVARKTRFTTRIYFFKFLQQSLDAEGTVNARLVGVELFVYKQQVKGPRNYDIRDRFEIKRHRVSIR